MHFWYQDEAGGMVWYLFTLLTQANITYLCILHIIQYCILYWSLLKFKFTLTPLCKAHSIIIKMYCTPKQRRLYTLKCSNLLEVTGVSRNLAGSELEAGEASRRLLRLFSGLSSGSEATWPPSSSWGCTSASGGGCALRRKAREASVVFLR